VPGDQLYVYAPLAVRVTEEPLHIEGKPGVTVIEGIGLTVTVVVAVFVHPFTSVPVTVYVVVTVGFAVTLGMLVALSPVGGDQEYIEAPLAVRVTEDPKQMEGATGVTATLGRFLTVTVTEAVLVHPAALVPVTIYVVEVVGLAITVVPVVPLSPAAGAHTYVNAPLAVRLTDPPIHIVGDAGLIVIVGLEFTVTTTVAVPVHPLPSVPVTV